MDHAVLHASANQFIDANLTLDRAGNEDWLRNRMDLCHLGFWLRIGAYFLIQDERMPLLVDFIVRTQMADGGWNCRIRTDPKTRHSSFHTTFNILEGLHAAAEAGLMPQDRFLMCESRAMEFMLAHRMYRSDRTGDVVNERFLHLTYPSYWHYTVLRGLDYMRDTAAITDERLDDPIGHLLGRRARRGYWPVENRIPGETLFEMEKMGGPSRWNTLRVLRVLARRGGN